MDGWEVGGEWVAKVDESLGWSVDSSNDGEMDE